MHEIWLCNGKYGVANSDSDTLCVFDKLNVAADFVNYIQGGTLTETQKFHVDEAIRKYEKSHEKGVIQWRKNTLMRWFLKLC